MSLGSAATAGTSLMPRKPGRDASDLGLVARDRAHPVENSGEVEEADHLLDVGVIGLNVKRFERPDVTSRTARWCRNCG